MLSFRIVKSIKEPMHKCLPLYSASQLYNRSKQFHIYKAAYYCISAKDETVHKPINERLTINESRETLPQYTDDIEPELNHYMIEDALEPDTRIKTELSPKKIEQLYPQPMTVLQNMYMVISNELKVPNVFHSSSETFLVKNKQQWKSTVYVTWPSNMLFVGIGNNKVSAGKIAALKCLHWLHANGKISNRKPVLYSKTEERRLLQQPVEINVDSKFINEIRTTIDTFNGEIESVISRSDLSNVSDILRLQRELENNDMTNIRSLPITQKLQRNYDLWQRLSTREDEPSGLPIFDHRKEILDHLERNRILLIKGDTGCGKTTQIPQFILDHFTEQKRATDCNMIVVQPRRLSAVSLAERIAQERDEHLGDVVGYQVRLETVLPKSDGSILFCTTGILLRKLQYSPDLEGVSHVIIDEAHERSTDIDILMVLLKRVMERNENLKIIVMSATINAELFQQYFQCPVVEVPGTNFPVKMHFLEDLQSLGIKRRETHYSRDFPEVDHESVVKLLQWIHRNKPSGAILCFLPGWSDITRVESQLNELGNSGLVVLPVHSMLPNIDQRRIFSPPPDGFRKIILATDIAETGITVSDVSYVVDTAVKKDMRWDVDKSVNSIRNHWISQANVQQRKGRAGRVKPGESYHFVSRENYDKLEQYPLPEVLRTSLDQKVLMSKIYSTDKAEQFFKSMPQPPPTLRVIQAVNNLRNLNILDLDENLTALGRRITHFTVDPVLAKAMIYSAVFDCSVPVVTIASLCSTDSSIFSKVLNQKSVIRETKQSHHKTSDHIALLSILNEWYEQKGEMNFRKQWKYCRQSYLNLGRLKLLERICDLHLEELRRSRMVANDDLEDNKRQTINADQFELIRAVLFSSTNNVIKQTSYGYRGGQFTSNARTLLSEDRTKVMTTQEGVNYNRRNWPSPYLTYIERTHNEGMRACTVRETSMISPLTVLLFSQFEFRCFEDQTNASEDAIPSDSITIRMGKTISLCCQKEKMILLLNLRSILWRVVDYIIEQKGVCHGDDEEEFDKVDEYRRQLVGLISKMIVESSKGIDCTELIN